MADMGVHMDGMGDERYTKAEITKYRPEKAWTYEAGLHWSAAEGLRIDADIFYIDIQDQQVTVFPEGKTAGRMMTNAARSRSLGAEATLLYRFLCAQGTQSALVAVLNDGFTDIVAVQKDEVLLMNRFLPAEPEDTLYHILNVIRQLNLRQPSLYLQFLAEENRKLPQLLKTCNLNPVIL